jgi:hypothetical protein
MQAEVPHTKTGRKSHKLEHESMNVLAKITAHVIPVNPSIGAQDGHTAL